MIRAHYVMHIPDLLYTPLQVFCTSIWAQSVPPQNGILVPHKNVCLVPSENAIFVPRILAYLYHGYWHICTTKYTKFVQRISRHFTNDYNVRRHYLYRPKVTNLYHAKVPKCVVQEHLIGTEQKYMFCTAPKCIFCTAESACFVPRVFKVYEFGFARFCTAF